MPPPNFAGTLAVINVEHPDHADWQPVLDLLGTPTDYTSVMQGPLQALQMLRTRVPEAAAHQLRPLIDALSTATDHENLPGDPDVRGLAAATLAALAPQAVSDAEMWTLLAGNAARRAAASQVIAVREQPEQLDALATLAFDDDPTVRIQAIGSLAYWVTQDVATDRALSVLTVISNTPGTEAARTIARAIDGRQTTPQIQQLAGLLRGHPSAYVRSVSAQHAAAP